MCHTRAMMHVGIANPRLWGTRSRHSRRMRNTQFYASDKRLMERYILNTYQTLKDRQFDFHLIYVYPLVRYHTSTWRRLVGMHYFERLNCIYITATVSSLYLLECWYNAFIWHSDDWKQNIFVVDKDSDTHLGYGWWHPQRQKGTREIVMC